MNKSHITEITTVLTHYFEGLYKADTKILSKVFHPDARYINTLSDEYMNLSILEYFSIVDERISPAENNESRNDRIISIELESSYMAFAKAKMTMMGREYLDYLTLIKHEDQWNIVSKVFHYQIIEQVN
jgi:hypothetical protein